jgi:hypothetical protein
MLNVLSPPPPPNYKKNYIFSNQMSFTLLRYNKYDILDKI